MLFEVFTQWVNKNPSFSSLKCTNQLDIELMTVFLVAEFKYVVDNCNKPS